MIVMMMVMMMIIMMQVCDLQPQKMCKQVYRLVPKLYPQEICEEGPREVCFTSLKNPRKVKTPLLTKWCFRPEPEEPEEPAPVYPPKPSLPMACPSSTTPPPIIHTHLPHPPC